MKKYFMKIRGFFKYPFGTDKKTDEGPEKNCLVADYEKGEALEYIETDKIPDTSYKRPVKGLMVYCISRDKDGKLYDPLIPRDPSETVTESLLYQASRCPQVQDLFGVPDTIWDKVSHGVLIGLIIVFGIFLFLTWGVNIG